MKTVTTQIDDELHGKLVVHADQRRKSMSQVIKDCLVALLLPPMPASMQSLPDLRRRPAPKVLSVAEAKRQAKGGRP